MRREEKLRKLKQLTKQNAKEKSIAPDWGHYQPVYGYIKPRAPAYRFGRNQKDQIMTWPANSTPLRTIDQNDSVNDRYKFIYFIFYSLSMNYISIQNNIIYDL